MAIKKLTKKEKNILIKEDPENRRTLLTLLAQEKIDIGDILRKILSNTDNYEEQGFSKGDYGKKEIFIYSLNNSTNPINQRTYCFFKTSKGYRKWESILNKNL